MYDARGEDSPIWETIRNVIFDKRNPITGGFDLTVAETMIIK